MPLLPTVALAWAAASVGAEPGSPSARAAGRAWLVVDGPSSGVRVAVGPTEVPDEVRVEVELSGDAWWEFRAEGRDHRVVDCEVAYLGSRDTVMGFTRLELRPPGAPPASPALIALTRQDDGNVSVWIDEDQDGVADVQRETAFTWGRTDGYLARPERLVGVAGERFEAGLAAADRGEPELAVARFRSSLEADPTPEAAFNLTVLLAEIGDPSEALDAFRRHQDLVEDDRAAEDVDGSTPWVERAIEARPRQAGAPSPG